MKHQLTGFFLWILLCLPQISLASTQKSSLQTTLNLRSVNTNATGFSINPVPSAKDTMRENVQDLTDRILKLEIDAVKISKSDHGNELRTAIIAGVAALIATLIGGGMTLLGQQITADRERLRANDAAKTQLELARKQAVFQHIEKILEFRIKQMEDFYAPMFALLKQSTALYNKMCDQLAQEDPNQTQYKLLNKPDTDGFSLYVKAEDGTWKPFRLLDRLPAVKQNVKAIALVACIVDIGKRTTELISAHAGLASAELIGLLGEYLAHYALLSAIYNGSETQPYEPGWHKTGYFPHVLHEKVEAGYRELSRFLDEYAAASKKMLNNFQVN